jgi:hypothetical protein
MPRAEIASKQAVYTLTQLHAELAGKFIENRNAAVKIRTAMLQVEAVLQMLQPGFSVRALSAKRRNAGNPWFKRGTLYRAVIDTLRKATEPMTADDICKALLIGKTPEATRKQENNLQAAVLGALRKRKGSVVAADGFPQRWKLKEAAN